ncbi:MAG: hypothetical protein IMW91_09015 [Firmicutes bacterium]|nr:hypothetical protein [Bacillota bacterium]
MENRAQVQTVASTLNLPEVTGPDRAKEEKQKEKAEIAARIQALYERSGGPTKAAEKIEHVIREHLKYGRDHGESGRIETYDNVIRRFLNTDRSWSGFVKEGQKAGALLMNFASQFIPRPDPGIEHVAKELHDLNETLSTFVTMQERMARLEAKLDLVLRQRSELRDGGGRG